MDNQSIAAIVMTSSIGLFIIWFIHQRYNWFKTIINRNPIYATLRPVITKATEDAEYEKMQIPRQMAAPQANFRQYLKYLYLACLPYFWSTPIKIAQEYWSRLFESKLTMAQRRQRLAKMILETSLILLFERKLEDNVWRFAVQNFLLPAENEEARKIEECTFDIGLGESGEPSFLELHVEGKQIEDMDTCFGFLNTLWCVYTHSMTHIEAGNIAELNLTKIKDNEDLSDDFKSSIDDMHSAVSGMNESANHYPADIWGIPRQNLQIVLGYNSHRQIKNHQNIIHCMGISKFVQFTMKARRVFQKHLAHTGISISTLSANTIFHSLDHYNLGKYMIHEKKQKSFLGIDSRMITSLLGRLNYDFGRFQGMQYTKYQTWRAIYLELYEIDAYLADKVHMFVSV